MTTLEYLLSEIDEAVKNRCKARLWMVAGYANCASMTEVISANEALDVIIRVASVPTEEWR